MLKHKHVHSAYCVHVGRGQELEQKRPILAGRHLVLVEVVSRDLPIVATSGRKLGHLVHGKNQEQVQDEVDALEHCASHPDDMCPLPPCSLYQQHLATHDGVSKEEGQRRYLHRA